MSTASGPGPALVRSASDRGWCCTLHAATCDSGASGAVGVHQREVGRGSQFRSRTTRFARSAASAIVECEP